MFRLIAFIALLPNFAAAEWSPRPLMFSYDATFAQCTAEPSAPDLGRRCYDILSAAYVLKRAVARAAIACDAVTFATCTVPFEEEGLPATAARIAYEVGCETFDITQLPNSVPVPKDHCVAVTFDILTDEGIVPLDTGLTCRPNGTDCIIIDRLNANLWRDAVKTLSDSDTTVDRITAARNECSRGHPSAAEFYACQSDRLSAIWADLAQRQ